MGFDRFRCVLSTVYFRFQNYHITDVVFISDNIVSFSFPIKKYESGNSGASRRSFSSSIPPGSATRPRASLLLVAPPRHGSGSRAGITAPPRGRRKQGARAAAVKSESPSRPD